MKRLLATLLIVVILCNVGLTRLYDEELYSFIPMKTGPDTVAYYKLWDSPFVSGSVFDYSLNGNTGTVTGALPKNPGYLFDAADDEIDCGSGSSIDDIFLGGGTASIWLLSDGLGQNNSGRAIGKDKWYLAMLSDTTTLSFSRDFTATPGLWTIQIVAGIWHHIVIVYDDDLAATNPTIYVNGISVTVTRVGGVPGNDNGTSDTTAKLLIGDTDNSIASWDGKIGEIMLFNTEKTAAEAKGLYETSRMRY